MVCDGAKKRVTRRHSSRTWRSRRSIWLCATPGSFHRRESWDAPPRISCPTEGRRASIARSRLAPRKVAGPAPAAVPTQRAQRVGEGPAQRW